MDLQFLFRKLSGELRELSCILADRWLLNSHLALTGGWSTRIAEINQVLLLLCEVGLLLWVLIATDWRNRNLAFYCHSYCHGWQFLFSWSGFGTPNWSACLSWYFGQITGRTLAFFSLSGYQTQGSRVHICCLWRQDHLSIQVQQFCKELGLWRQSLNFQLAHRVALWSVLPNLALEGNWQHQKILFFKQVQELFIWFWLVVKGFKRHSLLGTDYPLRLNP